MISGESLCEVLHPILARGARMIQGGNAPPSDVRMYVCTVHTYMDPTVVYLDECLLRVVGRCSCAQPP